MQLICLSVTHHNTPVEFRECLSLPEDVLITAFSEHPVRVAPYETISEMVVLSTCNRLEIYTLAIFPGDQDGSADSVVELVQAYIRDVFQIPTASLDAYVHWYAGIQAAEHLFRVAGGLDSIAIGETQILGQVSRALDIALRAGSVRHVLSSLFRAAIHAGKRVRSETEIGRHPVSISTLGVQLADSTSGPLVDRNVLIVGAGTMGGYTLECLRSRGVGHICLTNRSPQRALDLAGRLGGDVVPYEKMPDGLAAADVVFTSAASPLPIIHQDLLVKVMSRRPERSLTLIDLAVPRNVDQRAKEIPAVSVFDMDDIQSFARTALSSSAPEITRAEAIVAEEVAEYDKLLHIVPFIGELHKKIEDIRLRELEKTLHRISDISPEISMQIDTLTRSLVQKILHEPTMHLRSETDQVTLNEYVDTLARLFDLSTVVELPQASNNGHERMVP